MTEMTEMTEKMTPDIARAWAELMLSNPDARGFGSRFGRRMGERPTRCCALGALEVVTGWDTYALADSPRQPVPVAEVFNLNDGSGGKRAHTFAEMAEWVMGRWG